MAFISHFVLNQAAIFPLFYEIHPADEMGHLYAGRSLLNGLSEGRISLVPYGRAPLVMFLHGLFYVPVHKSPYWISLTSWGSRVFLFTLLWLVAYLIGKELRRRVDSRIYLLLLFMSPAIPRLLDNSSDALFAGVSGLALWQFLLFYRTRKVPYLAGASSFLGLAALSRNDGLVLFVVFLLLSAILTIRQTGTLSSLRSRAVKHLLVGASPFIVLVGGYIGLVRWTYGDWGIDTKARAYFAFEQAEGVAYSLAPEALTEGVFEARRLYGSPEENDYSVFRAIQNNPDAFVRRLLHVPLTLSVLLVLFYGGTIALVAFVPALIGAYSTLRRARWRESLIVLAWPAYLLVYVFFLARGGYLLTPYFAVLAVSAAGLMTLLQERSRNKILLVGALIAGLNTAFAFALNDDRMLLNTPLVAALSLAIARWDSSKRLSGKAIRSPAKLAVPYLLAFAMVLALAAPYPGLQVPKVGTTPEEKAGVYLAGHFPRHAVVASHMPAVVFMAKMNWRPMVWDLGPGSGPSEGRFQEFALDDSSDLRDWMRANQVDAIYMDDLLRQFQPDLYALIEQQIGGDLVEVFSVRDADPARADFFAKRGVSVVGWHRIVVARPQPTQ